MYHFPLCKICGKPVGWYDRKAHLKCIKGKNHHSNRLSKPITQYTKDGKFVTKWDSLMQLERVVGGRRQHVRDVCLGKRKTAYGFTWKYV